jgi:hypothetical protein
MLQKKKELAKIEKEEVERALKMLKVINFLFSNQDFIS